MCDDTEDKTRQAMYKRKSTKQGDAKRPPGDLEVVDDAKEVGVEVGKKRRRSGF